MKWINDEIDSYEWKISKRKCGVDAAAGKLSILSLNGKRNWAW